MRVDEGMFTKRLKRSSNIISSHAGVVLSGTTRVSLFAARLA